MILLEPKYMELLFKGAGCVNLEKYALQDNKLLLIVLLVSTAKILLLGFPQGHVKAAIFAEQQKL